MNTTSSIDPVLERQIAGELQPGETILWKAQSASRRYTLQDIITIFIGVDAIGVGLFGLLISSSHGGVSTLFQFPSLLGFIPLLVGIGMIAALFIRRRTALPSGYAITDKRGLIFQRSRSGQVTVRSIMPSQMSQRLRKQRSDGTGDITFQNLPQAAPADAGAALTTMLPFLSSNGFHGIPNVSAVDELIRRTFETGNESTRP